MRAAGEHARLAAALRECVPTLVFPGDPAMPDGVFPNNVFATVAGRAIVGAMRHGVRRREAARSDIRAFFRDLLHYELVDLSTDPVVAELTGALVIDRARGIGFCGLSERCDRAGAEAMHRAFGLELTFCFDLAPGEYHANVVLAQLASRALIIAPDGFADHAAAEAIAQVYAPRAAHQPRRKLRCRQPSLDAERWMSAGAAALTPAQRARGVGLRLGSLPLEEIEGRRQSALLRRRDLLEDPSRAVFSLNSIADAIVGLINTPRRGDGCRSHRAA